MTIRSAQIVALRSALTRLAEPAQRQADYLARLGVAPLVDELALDFDDAYTPLATVLPSLADGEEVSKACRSLDAALASGGLGWRIEDLGSPEWESVRCLAAKALASLPAR